MKTALKTSLSLLFYVAYEIFEIIEFIRMQKKPYVWELTEGQPWLVNALAYETCFELEKDRTKPITKERIEQAKENIILRRDTHRCFDCKALSWEQKIYKEPARDNMTIWWA